MENIESLNKKIMEITMKIRQNFPELLIYLDEMPITIPDEASPEIGIKALQDYYESLVTMMKHYGETHSKNIE